MVNTIYINTEYKIEIVLDINYAQLVLNVHLAGLKLGGNCNTYPWYRFTPATDEFPVIHFCMYKVTDAMLTHLDQ